LSLVFEVPVDSATRNVSGVGNVVERRLAYAIDYKTEGYYVLMSFTSAPEFPKELDRILGITEGVMRSMIVCKDE
jgi:ribosomal protein S6